MFGRKKIREISPEELRHFMSESREENYVLVDVRQPHEYREEHLPGAQLIPVSDLEARIPSLKPTQDYIFYCRSGARSMAAALMASDSQFLQGAIMSLQGGLLAWDGGSVAHMPRVNVFSGVSGIRDLLLRALELEKAAHVLYREVRAAAQRDAMCELMDTLIKVEEAHAKVVYRYLRKYWGDDVASLPPFEILFEQLEGKVLEGGLTVEDLGPWVKNASTGDCLELADLALEVELNAYDLYRTLAQQAVQGGVPDANLGTDAEPVFLDLAVQEKHHARLIMGKMASFEAVPPGEKPDATCNGTA